MCVCVFVLSYCEGLFFRFLWFGIWFTLHLCEAFMLICRPLICQDSKPVVLNKWVHKYQWYNKSRFYIQVLKVHRLIPLFPEAMIWWNYHPSLTIVPPCQCAWGQSFMWRIGRKWQTLIRLNLQRQMFNLIYWHINIHVNSMQELLISIWFENDC